MTGKALDRLLERWRAMWRDQPAPALLDDAWEDQVMAAVLAQRRTPVRAGLLDRLEDLAWAAWTAGATAAGLGLWVALRLPVVGMALDRLSILRTFYSFSPLF
jgi:hypothetical protein